MGEEQQLPEYVCHKRVRAALINGWARNADGTGTVTLRLQGDNGDIYRAVDAAYLTKHSVSLSELLGGYFVEYADGYVSWSPPKAFEQGYTRT